MKIYDYIHGVKREDQRAGVGGLSNSLFKEKGKEKKEGKKQKQWLEVGESGIAESWKARKKIVQGIKV